MPPKESKEELVDGTEGLVIGNSSMPGMSNRYYRSIRREQIRHRVIEIAGKQKRMTAEGSDRCVILKSKWIYPQDNAPYTFRNWKYYVKRLSSGRGRWMTDVEMKQQFGDVKAQLDEAEDDRCEVEAEELPTTDVPTDDEQEEEAQLEAWRRNPRGMHIMSSPIRLPPSRRR